MAGATKTIRRSASGWGAVRARVGKAWFWVRASGTTAIVHWDDRAARVHLRSLRGVKAAYAGKRLTLKGTGVSNGKRLRFTLVLIDLGKKGDRVQVALSNGYRRSGTAIRGGLAVR